MSYIVYPKGYPKSDVNHEQFYMEFLYKTNSELILEIERTQNALKKVMEEVCLLQGVINTRNQDDRACKEQSNYEYCRDYK